MESLETPLFHSLLGNVKVEEIQKLENSHFTLILERGTLHSVLTTMPLGWQVTIGGLDGHCLIRGHDILTGNPNTRKGST